MYDAILSWLEAHPELVAAVGVPLVLSVLSFADRQLAERWPVALAVLRALVPDVKRAAAILLSNAGRSGKLPEPPEVTELRYRRVEAAIERATTRATTPTKGDQ